MPFPTPVRGGWLDSELRILRFISQLLVDRCDEPEYDVGLTDQNDPWFVVCCGRSNTVLLHIARIGGIYACNVASPDLSFRCRDLKNVAEILARHFGQVPLH
jgi:hypothetical protein